MTVKIFDEPNGDDLANNWGTGLVSDVTKVRGTKAELEAIVAIACPGYRLVSVVDNGTSANDRAIMLCTDANHDRCLYAMGSYAGGCPPLQNYSSTINTSNWQLSLVSEPEDSSQKAQQHTVAFPYFVEHDDLDAGRRKTLEDKCLDNLKIKLICAMLMGKPKKALLMEYILSGTGGQLSERFLILLSAILLKFEVILIADEVMTGGRVGPSITMTTSRPNEFQKCVGYITMGKSMGCGLLLEKTTTLNLADSKGRGTSTELDEGEAYQKFSAIHERISNGWISIKRQRVLTSLKIFDKPNEYWGKGILLFTSKSRSHIMGTLKCRLVPRLEISTSTKLRRAGIPTNWNRISVNNLLMARTEAWLQHNSQTLINDVESPYDIALAKYLNEHSSDHTFKASELINFIANKTNLTEAQLMNSHRELKRTRSGGIGGGRCTKKHPKLVAATLRDASDKSDGFITAERKSKKRRIHYTVTYPVLQARM